MRLLEVVVALLLGALLVVTVWQGAAVVRRDGGDLRNRAAFRDALRVAGLVLDLEAEGFDGSAGRPREVAVRAHRWWAHPCGPALQPGRSTVAWRGLRRPDSAKDSVLLVFADGTRRVRPLARVTSSTACAPDGLTLEWPAPAGEPRPVIVRGFERGVYRLDDAFRYRRGRGGAQPLTAARFDPDSSDLVVEPARIRLRMDPRASREWAR